MNFVTIQVETDKGLVRSHNEDFAGYFQLGDSVLLVVCDGMGGHAAGDVASRLAVMSIGEFMEEHYSPGRKEQIPELLNHAFLYANEKIYKQALENPYQRGMGTTCVAAFITRDYEIYYGHVGDSRLYLYSEGKLKLWTKDHTFVQELVDKGAISEQEARIHPNRNVITRALGVDLSLEMDKNETPLLLKEDDILLLCTDGLTSMVADEEIAQIIEETPKEKLASKLVQAANQAGGHDNTTVIVAYLNTSNQEAYGDGI